MYLGDHALRKINIAAVQHSFFGGQRRALYVRSSAASWVADVLKWNSLAAATGKVLLFFLSKLLLEELFMLLHLIYCFSILLYLVLLSVHLVLDNPLSLFQYLLEDILFIILWNSRDVIALKYLLCNLLDSSIVSQLSLVIYLLLELVLELWSTLKQLSSVVTHLERSMFKEGLSSLQ